ncbi:hypothetical protein [Ferrovum myxofaciens]|uniref:hypothetical protein n=1 Tax=Ferrovum myxofaciens TaxID=416213 RepID=UPI003EB80E91
MVRSTPRKTYPQPSGLNRGIDFLIDAHWTPEQALAVVELLDDLRNRIWNHYQSSLFELLRQNIQTECRRHRHA